MVQAVKYLSTMLETQEIWVRPLGWEDSLEEEVLATHSTAWKIPWTEEPCGLQFYIESQRVRHD